MYSKCAHSSYGWICVSFLCMVRSTRTRLMAETLPRRKYILLFLLFPFDFHLMLVDIWIYTDLCEDRGTKTTWDVKKKHGDDSSVTSQQPWRLLMDEKRLEVLVWPFFFLVLLSFSRSASSSHVNVSNMKIMCVSKYVQESSAKISSCWWNTNAYIKISNPEFFLLSVTQRLYGITVLYSVKKKHNLFCMLPVLMSSLCR